MHTTLLLGARLLVSSVLASPAALARTVLGLPDPVAVVRGREGAAADSVLQAAETEGFSGVALVAYRGESESVLIGPWTWLPVDDAVHRARHSARTVCRRHKHAMAVPPRYEAVPVKRWWRSVTDALPERGLNGVRRVRYVAPRLSLRPSPLPR